MNWFFTRWYFCWVSKLAGNVGVQFLVVDQRIEIVWVVQDRVVDEVVEVRRRARLPFQGSCFERVGSSTLAVESCVNQNQKRSQNSEAQYKRTESRNLVEDLELRVILSIASRHTTSTHYELRKERQVKAKEH